MGLKRNILYFSCAILAGITFAIGIVWLGNSRLRAEPQSQSTGLTDVLFVRGQIALEDITTIGMKYRLLIDLRPDGEAPDQPSATTVAQAAQTAGLQFRYIPVSPGPIPEAAITELARTLQSAQGPILMYCRSGSRAARTWALAEASRPGGLDAAAILKAVNGAGFNIDDLIPSIKTRINMR